MPVYTLQEITFEPSRADGVLAEVQASKAVWRGAIVVPLAYVVMAWDVDAVWALLLLFGLALVALWMDGAKTVSFSLNRSDLTMGATVHSLLGVVPRVESGGVHLALPEGEVTVLIDANSASGAQFVAMLHAASRPGDQRDVPRSLQAMRPERIG